MNGDRIKGRTLSCLERDASQETKVRPHQLTQIETVLCTVLWSETWETFCFCVSFSWRSQFVCTSYAEVDQRAIRDHLLPPERRWRAPTKWAATQGKALSSQLGPVGVTANVARGTSASQSLLQGWICSPAELRRNVYSSPLGPLMNSDSSHTGLGINSFNHFKN